MMGITNKKCQVIAAMAPAGFIGASLTASADTITVDEEVTAITSDAIFK